jgi:hypothetical protein
MPLIATKEAEEQNASILSLVKAADNVTEGLRIEQDRVLTLYKKGKLDEARWEGEDAAYTRQIAEQQEQKAKLLGKLTKRRAPAYLADIKEACAVIAEGIDHLTREEKREVYELLCLTATLSVEGEDKVVDADCILDARKLWIRATKGDGGQGGIDIDSSSTRRWLAPGQCTPSPRRSAGRPRAAAERDTRAR